MGGLGLFGRMRELESPMGARQVGSSPKWTGSLLRGIGAFLFEGTGPLFQSCRAESLLSSPSPGLSPCSVMSVTLLWWLPLEIVPSDDSILLTNSLTLVIMKKPT